MQKTAIQIFPYTSADLSEAAQAIREILTTPPLDETASLSDIISQLQADTDRAGFNGVVVRHGPLLVGGAWWYAMTGPELQARWWPRFTPRDQVPNPAGVGVYLANIGVVPSARHRGLGAGLVRSVLAQIAPLYDWAATLTYAALPSASAMLQAHGFAVLPLTSTQMTVRVAHFKPLR